MIFVFFQINFLQKIDAAEACTKPLKQIRYTIQNGEDFYSILKNFGLEPVIGDDGSLEALLKINNMHNHATAKTGNEIIMPFNCEKQLLDWRVIDKGVYRLITSEKIDKTKVSNGVVKTENIGSKDPVRLQNLGVDQTTIDILNKNIPDKTPSEE
jgi:hypothetical protein